MPAKLSSDQLRSNILSGAFLRLSQTAEQVAFDPAGRFVSAVLETMEGIGLTPTPEAVQRLSARHLDHLSTQAEDLVMQTAAPATEAAYDPDSLDLHFRCEHGVAMVAGGLDGLASLVGGGGHDVSDDNLSFLIQIVADKADAVRADVMKMLYNVRSGR